ncbi:MAG TPA: hypothetical protein DCK87_02140 [Desulfotomaculum sp.]|nr:hypothetical protein [Desulfotomaculum sp.]
MDGKWYQVLFDKVKRSYHDLILVLDHDYLGRAPELRAALADMFALYDYNGELSLRRFLKEKSGRRVLIFKPPEQSYLPYDIEASAEVIFWQLREVFPKLSPSVLKTVPAENYQRIFDAYLKMESSLNMVDAEGTRQLLDKWLTEPAETGANYGKADAGGPIHPCKDREDETEYRCWVLSQQIEELLTHIPADWRILAPLWGELQYWLCQEKIGMAEPSDLDRRISRQFTEYFLASYPGLFYESYYQRPATIDKVLPFLANRPASKTVLLCMDGMGFQEWFCLKQYLAGYGLGKFNEMAVFALLPTITGVSRRALFCAKSKLKELMEEEKGFFQFVRQNWPRAGSRRPRVFINIDGRWHKEYLDFDYLGLVYNLVDDIAHSTINVQESKELMQKNMTLYLERSGFGEMMGKLLEEGYRVYLASDHGSVWCRGNGYQATKWLVEEKAKRALLFPNRLLAADFAAGKDLLVYENTNLLGDRVAVFPNSREMFGKKGETAISHGGIHLEEVIVPFVEVQR